MKSRPLVALAALFASALAGLETRAVAGPPDCSSTESCAVEHETPGGCNDPECCGLICSLDSFCCDTAWDSICVQLALELCPSVFGGCNYVPGHCFLPHPTPGCFDEACCNAVCDFEPLCCATEWDESCVEWAQLLCQVQTPCVCPSPGTCFAAHPTAGCADPACCASVCQIDDFCCVVQWDDLCAKTAVRVGCQPPCPFLDGDDQVSGGDITIMLSLWGDCDCNAPCPGDLNGDMVVDAKDIAVLLSMWATVGSCD